MDTFGTSFKRNGKLKKLKNAEIVVDCLKCCFFWRGGGGGLNKIVLTLEIYQFRTPI